MTKYCPFVFLPECLPQVNLNSLKSCLMLNIKRAQQVEASRALLQCDFWNVSMYLVHVYSSQN